MRTKLKEKLYCGKVADEPDTWVFGKLIDNDKILQTNEKYFSKCCGKGLFKVLPKTVMYVLSPKKDFAEIPKPYIKEEECLGGRTLYFVYTSEVVTSAPHSQRFFVKKQAQKFLQNYKKGDGSKKQ